jgi:hypothetical protein
MTNNETVNITDDLQKFFGLDVIQVAPILARKPFPSSKAVKSLHVYRCDIGIVNPLVAHQQDFRLRIFHRVYFSLVGQATFFSDCTVVGINLMLMVLGGEGLIFLEINLPH